MFRNYFKIAIRNLRKQMLFSGINIFGLSLAIACSLLLFLTAFRELSFDRFHENGKLIYRTYIQEQRVDEGEVKTLTMPIPLKAALEDKIDDIHMSTRWSGAGVSIEYNEKFIDSSIRFADPDILKMFSFKLLNGDQQTALDDLGSIVITQKQATKIFGTADPMGKSIQVKYAGMNKSLIVKGILEDTPFQSSLELSMVTRFENSPDYQKIKDNWNNQNHSLFVQIHPNSSFEQVEDKLMVATDELFSNEIKQIKESGANPDQKGSVLRLRLQPLYDLHFNNVLAKSGSSGSYIYPIALLIMGLFILAIACINFINLTMGTSMTRAMEVGVRKVLGASKQQLIGQFWGEATLIIIIALFIAMMSVQWFLPEYNSFFDGPPTTMNNPIVLSSIFIILFLVTLFGGGYPAFIISKFQPTKILKKEMQLANKGRLRNLLVVIQFSIAIVLISSTLVVHQQLEFLRNKPLGYNKEQIISLPVGSNINGEKALNLMRQKLSNHPDIKGITGSYSNFGMGKDGSQRTSIMGFIQDGKELHVHWYGVHYDYLKTLELDLVDGRSFDPERVADSIQKVIINESLAKQLGTDSPVGSILKVDPNLEIIGVVKDFHFKSLQEAIKPMCFVIDPNFGVNYLFVKVAPENMPKTMALLEKNWKEISPQSKFEASFLDENIDRQYKSEDTLSKIILFSALLTIILSCMGLFGIALLTILQRTKEIGVRKVLGASVGNIVTLISKDFLKLVFIASIIATPICWYAMNIWLQDFHYRIDLPWWTFIVAGIMAMLIAFTTVSFHSIRAAISNPIKALRSE